MALRRYGKKQKKKKSLLRRILKWTGISFLLLIILIILAPILFKNQIIQFVEDSINDSLNAEFKMGEVSLTLISTFPDFYLEIEDVEIVGVDEFEGVTLAHIGKTEVSLDLWSVIGGEHFEIHTLGLTKPTLNIHVLEDGTANYMHILIPDTTQQEEVVDTTESGPFKLALNEYFIRDANVVYDDKPMEMYIGLNNFTHEGRGDLTLDQVDFETQTSSATVDIAYGGIKYIKQAEIDVKADLAMDMTKMRFEFRDNAARINELELKFSGFFEMAEDYYDMDLSFNTNKNDFKSLLSMVPAVFLTGFESVQTDGTFSFKGGMKGKYSETSYPGFNMDLEVGKASFWYPDMPAKVTNIKVDAHVNRAEGPDFDNTNINVKKFHVELANNPVDVTLLLFTPISDPNINLGLDARIDLAKLKTVIPMGEGEEYNGIITSDIGIKGRMSALDNEDYENFQAKGQLGISAMQYTAPDLGYTTAVDSMLFIFSPEKLDLANLDAMIGESDFHANGTIDNYMAYYLREETIKGEFNISSKKFDMNELMSSYEEDTTAQAGPAAEEGIVAAEEEWGIIEVPSNIDFLLHSEFNNVIYDSLELNNISGDILVKESVADLRDLKMDALGGGLIVNGTYSTQNPKVPRVEFSYNIKDMDIKQASESFVTMQRIAPIAKKCTGKFSTDMTFNADLDHQMYPMYNTLDGKGVLKSKDVYIEDVAWMNKLASALKMNRLAKQNIKDVNIPFEFHDGRIFVSDVDVNLGKTIPTSIAGNMTFDQQMDYVMTMEIPRKEFGSQANEALEGLLSKAKDKGVDANVGSFIPVKVGLSGPATNPKVTTDFNDQGKAALTKIKDDAINFVKDTLKATAKIVVDSAKNVANDNIKEKTDEALRKAKEVAAKAKKNCESGALKVKDNAYKAADDNVKNAKLKDKLAAKAAAKIAKKNRRYIV